MDKIIKTVKVEYTPSEFQEKLLEDIVKGTDRLKSLFQNDFNKNDRLLLSDIRKYQDDLHLIWNELETIIDSGADLLRFHHERLMPKAR